MATFYDLLDEQCLLNRQILLAMEAHDETAHAELIERLTELQKETDQMCSNRHFLNWPPPDNIIWSSLTGRIRCGQRLRLILPVWNKKNRVHRMIRSRSRRIEEDVECARL